MIAVDCQYHSNTRHIVSIMQATVVLNIWCIQQTLNCREDTGGSIRSWRAKCRLSDGVMLLAASGQSAVCLTVLCCWRRHWEWEKTFQHFPWPRRHRTPRQFWKHMTCLSGEHTLHYVTLHTCCVKMSGLDNFLAITVIYNMHKPHGDVEISSWLSFACIC
jgi:hypothetical protein